MADYDYDAIQNYAADGTCFNACPVAIDTGKIVKEFRRRERTAREEAVAASVARRYAKSSARLAAACLLHPELPASAPRDAARDLDGRQLDACVCSNRTREVALSRETGQPYTSFLFLLEECTRRP
jgi:Fe-S oxidoreductase